MLQIGGIIHTYEIVRIFSTKVYCKRIEVTIVKHSLDTAIDRFRLACQPYYNIRESEAHEAPLLFACELYQQSEAYMVSRKVNLWTANAEEFLYAYRVPRLTAELFIELKDKAYADGRGKANIGPGHMCTYVTAVFFCEDCTEEAVKRLKKCSLHKTFLFSFHGWLDLRLAIYNEADGNIITNGAGEPTGDFIKKVLQL